MQFNPLVSIYLVPVLVIWIAWIMAGKARSKRALAILEDNRKAGLTEPSSLHPVIDPAKCLGCAACAKACPEQTILGIVDGKAMLIEPTLCVGHGACQAACPTDAITLVFGTETWGVDIPLLSPAFETSVPGIYIAGELGGMGLIKNAIEQGRQAISHIAQSLKGAAKEDGVLDVVIVGCGPAGIAASLGALEKKLSFETIDQSTLGGTVAHFPRGKLVMTAPAQLPLIGQMRFSEVNKETLLEFWEGVIAQTGLQPRFEEQVTAIARDGDQFTVRTSKGSYHTRAVLLAIGRRGTPRKLGVPGEELDKVVYRMIDPEQYKGQDVLVVGGGDSALEAAAEIAEQPGARVTLSYRGSAFTRARAKNRDRVAQLVAEGAIDERLGSEVASIATDTVEIEQDEKLISISNNAVIVCAGGILPTAFLEETGIVVETKYGTA